MDYKILEGRELNNEAADLVAKVKKAIAEGWAPIGGVAVLPDQCSTMRPRVLYQAMVKV